jgi:hypothetical protein
MTLVGDAAGRPGGPSRTVPAHRPCATGPQWWPRRQPTTGKPAGIGPEAVDWLPRRRGRKPEMVRSPGAMRSKPKTPRAGRLGFGGLAVSPPKGGSDFSMPRCCEASRSVGPSISVCADLRKLECARTLGVPRALGTFEGGRLVAPKPARAEAERNKATACPGPTQEYGRRRLPGREPGKPGARGIGCLTPEERGALARWRDWGTQPGRCALLSVHPTRSG